MTVLMTHILAFSFVKIVVKAVVKITSAAATVIAQAAQKAGVQKR